MKIKNICVFCSSSDVISEDYKKVARDLAKLMVDKEFTLVNGGSKVGLMGIMSRKVKEEGGKSIGVIPQLIYDKDLACHNTDELIVTENMRDRKEKLSELADAFIALPGGFGTLEELMEVLTLKQLEVHQKPIVIMNTNNFYKKLLEQFEVYYQNDFSKADYKNLYFVAENTDEAIEYIKNYIPEDIVSKWYKANLKL
ncbi:MAG: TIGR00730 family Rossman fold protein [Bacteroidetes bacterium]|nr:MAG: TIGR00730 family Rossman fold protein [Bacteroidota bacterium]